MEIFRPQGKLFSKYNNFLRYLIISKMCNRTLYLKALECLLNGVSPSQCRDVPSKKTVVVASITYRRNVVGNPNDRIAKILLDIVKKKVPVLVEEEGDKIRCKLCYAAVDNNSHRRLLCYNHMFYQHYDDVYTYMMMVWNEFIKTIKSLRARR